MHEELRPLDGDQRRVGEALHQPAGLAERVLDMMLEKHEPYPLVVFDCRFDVVRANRGAFALLGSFLTVPPPQPLNILDLVFDERYLKPAIASWEQVALHVLAHARRELHRNPDDEALGMRLRALARNGLEVTPTVDPPAAFPFRLERNGVTATFVTTLTTFTAPCSVAAEELRIETYFPLDEATDKLCRQVSRM